VPSIPFAWDFSTQSPSAASYFVTAKSLRLSYTSMECYEGSGFILVNLEGFKYSFISIQSGDRIMVIADPRAQLDKTRRQRF